ncbi:MAG: hypothetical protein HY926_12320 [Elusimicrobia bacterium]|nr:hypothetical protein [Elusimicrobiota bacterium]
MRDSVRLAEFARSRGGGPAVLATAAPMSSRRLDRPGFALKARPDDFALVIGIERYSKLPEARFAEQDAEAVKMHLEALGLPPRNIIQLSGSDATRSSLQGYLEEWLPRNVRPASPAPEAARCWRQKPAGRTESRPRCFRVRVWTANWSGFDSMASWARG